MIAAAVSDSLGAERPTSGRPFFATDGCNLTDHSLGAESELGAALCDALAASGEGREVAALCVLSSSMARECEIGEGWEVAALCTEPEGGAAAALGVEVRLISAVSRLPLREGFGCSRPHLGRISAASRPHLVRISSCQVRPFSPFTPSALARSLSDADAVLVLSEGGFGSIGR